MDRKYDNVMVDLETLGKRPDCVVLSIGACAFDVELGVGPAMYARLSESDQVAMGRTIDAETKAWWDQQTEGARSVFSEQSASPGVCIERLRQFIEMHTAGERNVKVWGNGSDFDNAILSHLCAQLSREKPWYFRHSRCFRTLIAMDQQGYELAKAETARATHHRADDDALWQSQIAMRLLRRQAAAQVLVDLARQARTCADTQTALREQQRTNSLEIQRIGISAAGMVNEYDRPTPWPTVSVVAEVKP